jgi:hypothetical protein
MDIDAFSTTLAQIYASMRVDGSDEVLGSLTQLFRSDRAQIAYFRRCGIARLF